MVLNVIFFFFFLTSLSKYVRDLILPQGRNVKYICISGKKLSEIQENSEKAKVLRLGRVFSHFFFKLAFLS